jgi:DNA-binding MarR family transcriptional regulator
MNTIRERVDYLLRLMPVLRQGIDERISAPRKIIAAHLNVGQLHILGYLQRGPASMSDVARWGHVALSTMTENIDRLVKLGLVARVRDPDDRRVIRIQMTAQGTRKFKRHGGQIRDVLLKLLNTLSEDEQQRLVAAFRTLETILLQR